MDTESAAGADAKRRERWALAGIVLLAAMLRLARLGHFSLWYDECASLFLTRYVDFAGSLFHSANNTEPPLQAIFVWLWNGIVSSMGAHPRDANTAFLLRLWPCFWSILSVPMLYLLARTILRDGRAALTAAFLFAISPFEITYAQELRIYSFYVFIAMAALWCMIRALEDNRPAHWIGMVLLMSVLPYAHFFSVWTIFTFNACFVFMLWPYRRHFWRWTFANAAMMILIAPALKMAYAMNNTALKVEIVWYPPLTWKTGLLTFKDFFAGYGPSTWAYWPLFALAAGLLICGLIALVRQGRWPMAALIAGQVFVPIAGNVVLWNARHFSFYEHRLFIFSAAVATIGIAAGLRALRPRAAGGLVLAAFTFFTLPGLHDYYSGRIHPVETHRIGIYDKVDFRSAAEYIESHWQEGDLIAYANHFMAYSMMYYSDKPKTLLCFADFGPSIQIKSFGNEALLRNHDMLPTRMDRATKKAKRVWFLESFGTTFEYKPNTEPVRAGFEHFWKRSGETRFDGLTATLYERPEPARNPWPPNVVVVLMDTTRADRVHAYRGGKQVMPFLDRFAKDGVEFDRAWSASSWTRPSVASLFTSLYPECHGVLFSAELEDPNHPMTVGLADSATTMAEWLHNKGYMAFGVQTNANCTQELGFAQGFDAGYDFQSGARADLVTDHVLNKAVALVPPYLVYAHYMDPHETYDPPPAYREIFGPLPALSTLETEELTVNFKRYYKRYVNEALGLPVDPADKNLPPLTDTARETMRNLYDGECRFMDDQIARMVNEMTKRDPETVVVILADHGEEFWEHKGMGHGTTLYAEEQRVPLFVRASGLAPGVNHTPVNTLGLLPTLSSLTHLPQDEGWQGKNWLEDKGSPVFGLTRGALATQQIDLASVIEENYHYIRDAFCVREYLFDTAADPAEQNNLALAQPDRVAKMRALLNAHAAADAACAKKPVAKPGVKLDPGLRESLDNMGYLNGAPKAAAPAAPKPAAASPLAKPINADPALLEQLRGMGYLNGAPNKGTAEAKHPQRICP